MPQAWRRPTAIERNRSVPGTGVGSATARPTGSSLGLLYRPQQYAVPPSVTAHVRSTPALMLAKRRPPATGVGTGSESTTPPLPSAPSTFPPQQYAAPLARSAQTCWSPAEMVVNV